MCGVCVCVGGGGHSVCVVMGRGYSVCVTGRGVDILNIYGLFFFTSKRTYFIISAQKHMLWVLIRSASVRRF